MSRGGRRRRGGGVHRAMIAERAAGRKGGVAQGAGGAGGRWAEEIAGRLGEADLARPVSEGGWSVKQVFAHLASWGGSPAFYIGMAQRAASGGGEGPGVEIDAFNAQQGEMRQDRTPPEPLAGFRRGHEQGVAPIKAARAHPL